MAEIVLQICRFLIGSSQTKSNDPSPRPAIICPTASLPEGFPPAMSSSASCESGELLDYRRRKPAKIDTHGRPAGNRHP